MLCLLYYIFIVCTGLQIMLMSLPRPRPKGNFVADHPFVVTILTRSNDILFMGRLSKL